MAHVFVGSPPYLAEAARILGVTSPEALEGAIRARSLARLADSIAAASLYTHPADRAKAPGILAEAKKSRDALAVAALAAELMLSEAHATHHVEGGSPVLSPTAWEGTRAHDASPAEVEALAEVARLTGEVERLKAEARGRKAK